MKAPDFQYVRPRSLEQAIRFLDDHAGRALPLAGGQSLLAGLNMRVSSPEFLVDIGDVEELKGINETASSIRIGALSTHREVLRSTVVGRHLPLLSKALRLVAHAAVRNRGTFGGSLAYADPAAELPACTVALCGTVVAEGVAGRREIPAAEFFSGLMETALRPGELIVEIVFPLPPAGTVSAIEELSRRHGDFALAGLVAVSRISGKRLVEPRLVYFGCVQHTSLARSISQFLSGAELPVGDLPAMERALQSDIEPSSTPGCSAQTRRQFASVLTRRVLQQLGNAHE